MYCVLYKYITGFLTFDQKETRGEMRSVPKLLSLNTSQGNGNIVVP